MARSLAISVVALLVGGFTAQTVRSASLDDGTPPPATSPVTTTAPASTTEATTTPAPLPPGTITPRKGPSGYLMIVTYGPVCIPKPRECDVMRVTGAHLTVERDGHVYARAVTSGKGTARIILPVGGKSFRLTGRGGVARPGYHEHVEARAVALFSGPLTPLPRAFKGHIVPFQLTICPAGDYC